MSCRALFSGSMDFYPRPPRGGRRACWAATRVPALISIHALREEGDRPPGDGSGPSYISIHALREEGDASVRGFEPSLYNFYPRPPRGGRRITPTRPQPQPYFYPRPPRGGRPALRRAASLGVVDFYPRPPRGGRLVNDPTLRAECEFLSTPSARRATTKCVIRATKGKAISIHALREEGDNGGCVTTEKSLLFLSTPSARRATSLPSLRS